MKKFTHAWLAFMAVKRLEATKGDLKKKEDREYAENLINWFKSHKDGVIQGAWFPDALIKDMADNHVFKFAPADKAPKGTRPISWRKLKKLPREYLIVHYVKDSPVRKKAFKIVDENDNLPDRCESLAQSVIDQLKVQEYEAKGSPVSPTDNQVALWLFMLSHYIADAHVPVHCDGRGFSYQRNIHDKLEKAWDKEILKYYRLNEQETRFIYNTAGYPAMSQDVKKVRSYQRSFLKDVADELAAREFGFAFGDKNNNVWDFVNAICQNSYMLAYRFFPPQYGPHNVTSKNWKYLARPPGLSLHQLSTAVLADAIDSIARVWFRVWRRYEKWRK